nr:exodeoxyribonuclease-like isoform X1 [Lytechinus pictus]
MIPALRDITCNAITNYYFLFQQESKASNDKDVDQKKTKVEESEPKEEVYTTDRKSESGKAYNLKISAWNIGGMKAWIKKGGIDYITKESPDIFLAQETKVDATKPPPEAALDDYHITYNAAEKKGYSGVALFSKKKPISVTKGMGIEEHDKEGRMITAEYDSFYFVGVYVPNSSRGLVRLDYRQEWDKDFMAYLKKLDAKKPVICCGDMNVAHEEIDLKNPKSNRNKTPGFTDQEREGFTALLDTGFVDSFRHLYPEQADAYSFWTYMGNCRAKNVGWRLDYGVISKSLVPKLCDNQMRTQTFGSDHCPMVVYMAM